MVTAQHRRIVAAWGRQVAFSGWKPEIPTEALILAYSLDTEEGVLLSEAKDSVGALLPKLLDAIRKHMGDRYHVNASEARGRIFYFFAPRQPVDAFNLTLSVQGDMAHLSFGYIPYKLNGKLDIANMKSEKAVIEPDLAGMAMMRLVRNLLGRI